jgi:hypothetical protein
LPDDEPAALPEVVPEDRARIAKATASCSDMPSS